MSLQEDGILCSHYSLLENRVLSCAIAASVVPKVLTSKRKWFLRRRSCSRGPPDEYRDVLSFFVLALDIFLVLEQDAFDL
jgi:hypothetical protein